MLEKYYQAKGCFTTVFNEKINSDMPEFAFEVLSYFNEPKNCYSTERLTITNSSTGETFQKISIPELALFSSTHVSVYHEEPTGFELGVDKQRGE